MSAKRSGPAAADRKQLVATAQRSYQVFFVLDDQSVAESAAAAGETTPPIQAPAQNAAKSETQVSGKSKRAHRAPQTGRRSTAPCEDACRNDAGARTIFRSGCCRSGQTGRVIASLGSF